MAGDSESTIVHLTIRGRVQGVWYRSSAAERARELGLSGWVRNCDDGSVEALAAGRLETVEAFVAWCRDGPELARVDDVVVVPRPDADVPPAFEIRR